MASPELQFSSQLEERVCIEMTKLAGKSCKNGILKKLNKYKKKWRTIKAPTNSTVPSVIKSYPPDFCSSMTENSVKYETDIESLIECRRSLTNRFRLLDENQLENALDHHSRLLQHQLENVSRVNSVTSSTSTSTVAIESNVTGNSKLLELVDTAVSAGMAQRSILRKAHGINTRLPSSAILCRSRPPMFATNHKDISPVVTPNVIRSTNVLQPTSLNLTNSHERQLLHRLTQQTNCPEYNIS